VLGNETACEHERHGCSWAQAEGRCVDVFSVSTALTYAADKVGGYWFSTQGPGENRSWAVVGKAVANATCVNAAVNAVVDHAGAAACREQVRKTPSWSSSWANFSLLQQLLHSHRNAQATLQQCFWANLTPFSLQRKCPGDGSYPRDGEERIAMGGKVISMPPLFVLYS
jgi:hypothetical protein